MTRLNIPLFVALAASILCAIDARDQLPHQRMIRKRSALPRMQVEERAPAFVVPRWEVRQAGPSSASSASVSASSAAASSSASASASASKEASTSAAATSSAVTSSAAQTSSAVTTSSAASTSSGGLLDSLTSLLATQSSTTLSSTSSIASTSIVSTSTSSVAPSTSSTAQAVSQTPAAAAEPTTQPTLNLATGAPSATTPGPSYVVVSTTSTSPAEASVVAEEKAKKTAKITRNTIISLVVVASCIGGAVAIWTVIRKWKLSPSERFDDRMQPIDWAPTGGAGAHDVPVDEKARHGRTGSTGSHGSFTSGGVGQSETGHAARSVYSGTHGTGASQYGAQPAQDFPPAHDFTAGSGQYYQGQQYAGAGYADLQRGASVSESNYSHGGAGVTRGMSFSRGPAGYEAQPGGAVPPMPNPYGGGFEYEEHERQAGPVPVQGQYRGC